MPLDQDRMDEPASNAIARVAARLKAARAVAVITGAGISAESGVPTFRGGRESGAGQGSLAPRRCSGRSERQSKGASDRAWRGASLDGAQGALSDVEGPAVPAIQEEALWRSYRPEDLATPEAFARDPALVWAWYRWRRRVIAGTRPNPGHVSLARLENRFEAFTLLTQNVDGLHREAGSRRLVELHGNIWRARCGREPWRVVDQRGDTSGDAVPRCSCGAPLRPDVVWFGEPLDQAALERAAQAVSTCEVLLVVGTSAVVYPVAVLPALARRGQAMVVEVNVEETPLSAESDAVLRGPSGVLLPELERLL